MQLLLISAVEISLIRVILSIHVMTHDNKPEKHSLHLTPKIDYRNLINFLFIFVHVAKCAMIFLFHLFYSLMEIHVLEKVCLSAILFIQLNIEHAICYHSILGRSPSFELQITCAPNRKRAQIISNLRTSLKSVPISRTDQPICSKT